MTTPASGASRAGPSRGEGRGTGTEFMVRSEAEGGGGFGGGGGIWLAERGPGEPVIARTALPKSALAAATAPVLGSSERISAN